MNQWIAIALGGACGAVARYGASLAAQRILGSGFPWSTLFVNVAGCLLLGALTEWVTATNALTEIQQKTLGIGFLGALTTFSTFAHDTVRLLQEQRHGAALANTGLNLVVGMAAVWLGIWLMRR